MCYWCGRLNHFDKDCERWIQSNGTLQPKDQEYGPWIRAAPLPTHKNSIIVVLGYYEAKKKELEAEGKKQGTSGSKAPATAAQTESQGGRVNEFQLQNPAFKEKINTDVTEINKETDASLDLQSIGFTAGNKGEYFTEKINEIDEELRKFELDKDTLNGDNITDETPKSQGCGINEVAHEVGNEKPVLESRDLLSEPIHHVLYPNKNTKPADVTAHFIKPTTLAEPRSRPEEEKKNRIKCKEQGTWVRYTRVTKASGKVPEAHPSDAGREALHSTDPRPLKRQNASLDDVFVSIPAAVADEQPRRTA